MLSTKELNKEANNISVNHLKEYFKELPIKILSVNDTVYSHEITTYTYVYGVFDKKEAQGNYIISNYLMRFSFKGETKEILLNEDLLRDKEPLINSLKWDLGLR